MFKRLFAGAGMLLLAACALVQTENSFQDQVARLEAGYNATLTVLTDGREPCVDEIASNDDLCFIDDDTYLKIDPFVQKADEALDKAAAFADENDGDSAQLYIDNFKSYFATIKDMIADAKGE